MPYDHAGAGTVTMGGATRIDNIPVGSYQTSSGAFTTLSASTSLRQPWTEITAATTSLAVNSNFLLNRGGGVVATLPATAAVGDMIHIAVSGAGAGQIAQNAGQQVNLGVSATTVGVGGSLTSTNQFDTITLVCCVTNTTFLCLSAVGNWTIV